MQRQLVSCSAFCGLGIGCIEEVAEDEMERRGDSQTVKDPGCLGLSLWSLRDGWWRAFEQGGKMQAFRHVILAAMWTDIRGGRHQSLRDLVRWKLH